VGTVDDYLATLDDASRQVFQRVVDVAMAEAGELGQGTSYGLAALTYRGKPLLGLRAAARHLSVFPFSGAVVDAARDQLAGFSLSSGTVRFDAQNPLPEPAVRALVRARVAEIEAREGR
jgi:uncharacterized protein YdhG (YjbR/CyaY superfamily)